MKPIQRNEVLGLAEYEQIRDRFRSRVIESKRSRRVRVNPEMSMVFENRDTALLQIQEMLRTERITSEAAVAHEIETYNDLVPGDAELSACLFIEIPDHARREEMLVRWCAVEEHVAFVIDGEICRATFEEGRRDAGRAAAVQYLKFPLTAKASAALAAKRPAVIRFDHPNLQAVVELTLATVSSLAADLAG
jgi:hypothetical protein